MIELHQLDPCRDPRWKRFVENHPESSVFHTPEWLDALRRTYDYRPIAFTTSASDLELNDGLVFCHIESWLTGRRLVSLPFSDHTAVLASDAAQLKGILLALGTKITSMRCRFAEIRPVGDLPDSTHFASGSTYYWHRLCLRPEPEVLFRQFHHSCIQRKVLRAERESLEYSVGRSESFLRQFYTLLLMTHARHRAPTQPISWFRNLLQCLQGRARIHVASKNGNPIASMLTLGYKQTLVYKYGGSDPREHGTGGVPFLFWKVIRDAKNDGFVELDLGRSDLENQGLIKFKENWGAQRYTLVYRRFPERGASETRASDSAMVKKVLKRMPTVLLPLLGRAFYRHIG